jgi:exodeoxyribonuclease-3
MIHTTFASTQNVAPSLLRDKPATAAAKPVVTEATSPEPNDSCQFGSLPLAGLEAPSPEVAAAGVTPQALAATSEQVAQELASSQAGPAGVLLKVLSFNIKFDGISGIGQVEKLIRTTGADLVGLQESNTATRLLAKKLGMHYLQQDKRTALLSRFPFEKTTDKRYGVQVALENGQKVGFLNAHLTSFPYQAHQLCHLPQGGGPNLDTEEQAVESAKNTRGHEVQTMLKEANDLGVSIISTGDFNEPSFLDWTDRAAAAGRNPIKVDWPASRAYAEAGFSDSYRVLNPDEMTHPGNTWTPDTRPDDPNDHHDRIDFVYYRGQDLKLKNVQVVGESTEFSDLVISPFPSDHRAVLATFEVAPPT